jgi:hypothetical protein
VNFLFDLADGAWKLVKLVCRPFWRFSRGLVTAVLPGQPRFVHTVVAAALVLFELGLVWYLIAERVYGD